MGRDGDPISPIARLFPLHCDEDCSCIFYLFIQLFVGGESLDGKIDLNVGGTVVAAYY